MYIYNDKNYLYFNNIYIILLCFISIHLYILEIVLSLPFFHKLKSVYLIYQHYFEYLKNKNTHLDYLYNYEYFMH